MELGYFTLPAGEKLAERHSVRVCGDIPELTPGLDVYQCVWEPTETGVVEVGALESVILISSVPAPTTLTLYHGSPVRDFTPTYGFGQDKHDYGRGFYLTASKGLACEWAVCQSGSVEGWLHKYSLDIGNLKIFDFQDAGVLSWLAELMKHRVADTSRRYSMYAPKFIEKYGVDTSGYDIIKGWRADASYFCIAKAFVRDEVDVSILEELLKYGDLGIQYCCKTSEAFAALQEVQSPEMVPHDEFNPLYVQRDTSAREKMRALINSDRNSLTTVFSDLIGR